MEKGWKTIATIVAILAVILALWVNNGNRLVAVENDNKTIRECVAEMKADIRNIKENIGKIERYMGRGAP